MVLMARVVVALVVVVYNIGIHASAPSVGLVGLGPFKRGSALPVAPAMMRDLIAKTTHRRHLCTVSADFIENNGGCSGLCGNAECEPDGE